MAVKKKLNKDNQKEIYNKIENIAKKIDNRFTKISQQIDEQTEKLFQMQDLTSVQTSLLAILFSLLIFSVTVVTYYRDLNIIMTIFSLFIFLIGIPIILYLIASIFIGNLKNKLFNFEMVLLYVTISGIIIILTLIFVGFNILFPSIVHVNNIVAVIIVVSTFGIFIYTFPRIQKRYYERFDKLYIPEIKKEDIRNKFIKFVLRRTIWYSTIISLFITILTGLWEKSELSVPEEIIYGYPFPWMTQYSDKIPSLEINYQPLFGNWFLYGLIIFTVLIFIQYIFRKKFFNRFIKKTIVIKKET